LVTARQAAEEEGVTRKRLATKQCQGRVSYGVGSQAIYRGPCSTAAGFLLRELRVSIRAEQQSSEKSCSCNSES
jgi:hypothetical protein